MSNNHPVWSNIWPTYYFNWFSDKHEFLPISQHFFSIFNHQILFSCVYIATKGWILRHSQVTDLSLTMTSLLLLTISGVSSTFLSIVKLTWLEFVSISVIINVFFYCLALLEIICHLLVASSTMLPLCIKCNPMQIPVIHYVDVYQLSYTYTYTGIILYLSWGSPVWLLFNFVSKSSTFTLNKLSIELL